MPLCTSLGYATAQQAKLFTMDGRGGLTIEKFKGKKEALKKPNRLETNTDIILLTKKHFEKLKCSFREEMNKMNVNFSFS